MAITEKTALMQLQPVRSIGGESGPGPSTSREETFTMGRRTTVKIQPGSIRFPVSMVNVQVQVVNPLEVNLAKFPVELLQEIQHQVGGEL